MLYLLCCIAPILQRCCFTRVSVEGFVISLTITDAIYLSDALNWSWQQCLDLESKAWMGKVEDGSYQTGLVVNESGVCWMFFLELHSIICWVAKTEIGLHWLYGTGLGLEVTSFSTAVFLPPDSFNVFPPSSCKKMYLKMTHENRQSWKLVFTTSMTNKGIVTICDEIFNFFELWE